MLLMGSVVSALVLEPFALVMFLLLCLHARSDLNSLHLTLIFVFIYSLEAILGIALKYFIFPLAESYYQENVIAFSAQAALNLSLLLLIKYRMYLSAYFTKGRSFHVFERNPADTILFLVVGCMFAIDLSALCETFLRNS